MYDIEIRNGVNMKPEVKKQCVKASLGCSNTSLDINDRLRSKVDIKKNDLNLLIPSDRDFDLISHLRILV